MRAPLRHAVAVLRAAGFEIDQIRQAGRHTEVHFIGANGGGLVRVHRGNRVSVAFERNLRSIIRKHLRNALRNTDNAASAPLGRALDVISAGGRP